MRLLINHLTRMHGGHICLAGVDLQTRRHVRPVLANEPLPFYLLARYGGPFENGWVVELGSPRHLPDPPHVEDYVFVSSRAKFERLAAAHEYWAVLEELHRDRLREIFGPAIREVGNGHFGTELGEGDASLGILRPEKRPVLFSVRNSDGKRQIRMRFRDGEVEVDAAVTDLRLYGDDHATPDEARIRAAAQWIVHSKGVMLSIGLTRKYRSSKDAAYRHWLQVNNIHLMEDPCWPLG
jgi:hypothetical protein